VLPLTVVKDSLFNKENRRKDAGGVNVQDQAIVTKNTVEVKVEEF